MLYIQEAQRLWDQEFGHMVAMFDDKKSTVSRVAWVNGYVYGKIDLMLTLEEELKQLIKDQKLYGVYDIEFQNGYLHGVSSK